jgi:4-diphosphocytidyl-2-C-methyl-D-erythritol kinase
MQIKAYAKINWSLRVIGKRADGYHDIETLFQAISLYDTITIMQADSWSITCDDPIVPCDDTNLVMRAARAIGAPPLYVALQKRIPTGGGLGGGSSDAAATLLAVDQMFSLRTAPDRLREIALSLGSDVPFFLNGGTAYATGRGEQLTSLAASKPIPLLLVCPHERVSTAEAYALIRKDSRPMGVDRYRTLVAGDLLAHADELVNDFEEPVFARTPLLRDLRDRMSRAGAAWARMSGSGSTIVGAFRSQSLRDAARSTFADVRTESAETLSNIAL